MRDPSSSHISPLIFVLLSLTITLTHSYIKQHLVDNNKIPMFPNKQKYNHLIYAGYLNILPGEKQLYYFFFESQNKPKTDPVVLWLNGGPGCSSLMGMVSEHGPFMFIPGTTQMQINPYSWNKNASIIYLQSPGNVGFSYASDKYKITNDTQTAKDNLAALRYFLENYKEFQTNNFYLSGQSYAGIYIPMLARQILQFNQGDQQMRINLRGMLLGNPCTHPLQCYTATYYPRFFTQFLYTHAFLDQSVYNEYNQQCLIDQMSKNCIALQYKVKNIFQKSKSNIYNVYAKCYYTNYPPKFQQHVSEQIMNKFEQKRKNLKHPLRCSDALGSLTLFNTNQYRQFLNVQQKNDTLFWTPCAQDQDLDYTIQPQATYNILPILVKSGLKIIYYSGDQDAIVPLEGTKWWFQQYRAQFGAAIKKSWRPWVTNTTNTNNTNYLQQISGMVWQLEGLTLATVIGAGHMVPSDKPIQAKQIFDIFLGLTDWKQPDYFEE